VGRMIEVALGRERGLDLLGAAEFARLTADVRSSLGLAAGPAEVFGAADRP